MKEKLPPNLDPNFTDIHPVVHYIPIISLWLVIITVKIIFYQMQWDISMYDYDMMILCNDNNEV